MAKPNAAKIRAAVPLTKLLPHGADPLDVCNVCGLTVDPSDLPLTVWREHDERDRPVPGVGGLVFLGEGSAHAACRRTLEEHPRLYAEETGDPGHFPALCGPCVHRSGLGCKHPDLRANGGKGLGVTLGGMANVIICTRGAGCHTPVRRAEGCVGRRTWDDERNRIAMMNLRTRVRAVVAALDKVGPSNAAEIVEPLRRYVSPNVHVGRTGLNPDEAVEWYAGQILEVIDSKSWFAVNSLLNAVDKFAPAEADEVESVPEVTP